MNRLKAAARQRGVIGIVSVIFIILVAVFAMSQTANIAASNMTDSTRQLDAVEALFLAEGAVERVGMVFRNDGTHACTDAALGVGTDYSFGRGAFRVLSTATTNFNGTALPSTPASCRVRVQGEVTASKVKRTLEVIVATDDDIISISSLNPNYNDPVYEGARTGDESNPPSSWTLTSSALSTGSMNFIPWDYLGGNDDDNKNAACRTSAQNCDRAMFVRKTDTGNGTSSAGGAFNTSGTPINITVPTSGSKTLRLTFDFRVWGKLTGNASWMYFSPRLVFNIGGVTTNVQASTSFPAGGDCDSNSGAGWCESGITITTSGEPYIQGGSSKGCGFIDTPCFESGPADATACPTYDPSKAYTGVGGTTGKANTYAECTSHNHTPPTGSDGFKSGYLTYVISCAGGCTATLTSVAMTRSDGTPSLQTKSGQYAWIWVDNLRLSVPSLAGGGPTKIWREVASP